MKTIWDFSEQLSQTLLNWSSFSVGSGWGLMQSKRPFWRGVGMHFVVWGLIDGVIALIGLRNAQKGRNLPTAEQVIQAPQEAKKLRRLLWINTGLDVLYMLGGWWVYKNKGEQEGNDEWRGQGIGIIIQGGFLFFFDLIQARRTPSK